MPRQVQTVCYVDFSGNLRETACGEPFDPGIGYEGFVTVFLTGITCPACRRKVEAKLDARFATATSSPTTYSSSPAVTA